MCQPKDSTAGSTNQKVYDQQNKVDHQVEVVDIYFADRVVKYKWEKKEDIYTVKSGGTLQAVVKIKQDALKKEIKAETARNIEASHAETVNPAKLKKGDQIKITWEVKLEDGFDYPKITQTRVGKKVFLTAQCIGDSGKLKIEIFENQMKFDEKVYSEPIAFLDGDKEVKKIEFPISSKTQIYAKEIRIRPKSDADTKALVEKFEKRENKNAFLYVKCEIVETSDEKKYPDETREFLNKEGKRLEIFGTPCLCNKELEVKEMIQLIYLLRDKENYKADRDKFFDKYSEHISSIRITEGKIDANEDKIKLFTDEMNTMFKKFGINTCKRKIHCIAQMYLETISFRATWEARSSVPENYKGGVPFQGRGMKQITHDYNYLAYYDYVEGTNLSSIYLNNCTRDKSGAASESVGGFIENNAKAKNTKLTTEFYDDTLKPYAKKLSEDLFHAFNSAGWYTTVYKPSTLAKMDNGLTDEDVRLVTKAINGGENHLAERKNYTKWTKGFFNYDTDCINK